MTCHRMSDTREYKAWQRMKNMCYLPSVPTYKKYGAKGIRISSSWMDFRQFLKDLGELPQGCNGISRKDETIDFCKENCFWSHKTTGRTLKPKIREIIHKYKKVKFKKPRAICLVMEQDHLDFIKHQALQRSMIQGVYVEPNELIREALIKAFPAPKQYDLFGDHLRA